MYASVTLRDATGAEHELVHGDIIGRVWSAALHVDDGRVSEAHAMVSLREGELHLIMLRGALAVGGRPLSKVALTPGVVVHLARDLPLEVVEVSLPASVLAIEGPGLTRQALPGVCSIVVEPGAARLMSGWRDDAAVQLWTTGDGWRARGADGAVRDLGAGDVLTAGPHTLRLVAMTLMSAGLPATRRAGELDAPITVIAQFDNVHLQRAGAPTLVLPGKQGQLVSELVACGGPMGWAALAAELWPDATDDLTRRMRLDALLSKLRRRLRGASVREDLVGTDGAGQVGLLLHAHDTLIDRT